MIKLLINLFCGSIAIALLGFALVLALVLTDLNIDMSYLKMVFDFFVSWYEKISKITSTPLSNLTIADIGFLFFSIFNVFWISITIFAIYKSFEDDEDSLEYNY